MAQISYQDSVKNSCRFLGSPHHVDCIFEDLVLKVWVCFFCQGPPKQQPKWSAVAAMDRQATHGQAGTSSGGGGPPPLRKEGSGDVLRGSSPSARSEPSKRQASGSSSNLRKSGSGNQLGTARSSGSTRTAGTRLLCHPCWPDA